MTRRAAPQLGVDRMVSISWSGEPAVKPPPIRGARQRAGLRAGPRSNTLTPAIKPAGNRVAGPLFLLPSNTVSTAIKKSCPGCRRGSDCGRQHSRARERARPTARRGQRPWHVQTLLGWEPGGLMSGRRWDAIVARGGKARSRSRRRTGVKPFSAGSPASA